MTEKAPETLYVHRNKNETEEQALSRVTLCPIVKSARTIRETVYHNKGIDLTALTEELTSTILETKENGISRLEPLLISQAHTLDALFHRLTMMALEQRDARHINALASLAFKAQNQCRMTIGTISEIKNPRPYIQNNKAQYQQVNNGSAPPISQENSKLSNELLEEDKNEEQWMDIRAQEEASPNDSELETMEEKHRC